MHAVGWEIDLLQFFHSSDFAVVQGLHFVLRLIILAGLSLQLQKAICDKGKCTLGLEVYIEILAIADGFQSLSFEHG